MLTFRPGCEGCTYCAQCDADVCLETDPAALDEQTSEPRCDNCVGEPPC